jgi:leucyl-tRNA synthetase
MDFKKVADKWQKKWEAAKLFEVKEDPKKKKFYSLEMFPYPSGSGLHMGHAFNYTIGDIQTRFKRMNGFNVLYPMGYDSLGLPAENAAIKENVHPQDYTEKGIANFIRQQKQLGLSYDWTRVFKTHDPKYYRWDQWIFLKMLEKGIAYRKKAAVNWCSKCNSVLANEQVHNGKCWRHGDCDVEIKQLEQWFFRITDYAEELYDEIENLTNWEPDVKAMQKNWIGKSYGTEVTFKINNKDWTIFTTRPDTIYGVTFMVIAAQHPRLMELVTPQQKKEVEAFLKKLKSTSDKDLDTMEKEGVFTGSYAVNPLTNDKVPVYAGNFVIADYGAGMVMAVPAHDQRDFEFAKQYKIPVKVVIEPTEYKLDIQKMNRAYTSDGKLVNSGEFTGLFNKDAIEEISKLLEKKKLGKRTVQYRLKDWLISRQRYWGTPIPIIYCDKCGAVPVPEKELPIELPRDVKFGSGNPLLTNKEFVNVLCPKCKGKARRETDTMDTFVNSSWYFLRYCDPHNDEMIFDKKKAAYWLPIDQYIGGKEHACMHLIYFRFYTKFLRDLGLLKIDEPTMNLFNQGMVHGSDGAVMSKSRGNGIDPMDLIGKYGTDALRWYLVSTAGPNKDWAWSETGFEGSVRFLQRIAALLEKKRANSSDKKIQNKIHRTIKEVTRYIQNFEYNKAVITLTAYVSYLGNLETVSKESLETLALLLAPIMPHTAEEMWEQLGHKEFISVSAWPKFDEKLIDDEIEFGEEAAESVLADIANVLKLTKIENPKQIKLIIADTWKYEYIRELKNEMTKTFNVGDLLKKLMSTKLKQYGQDITKLTPGFVKDQSKLPKVVLDQNKEFKAFSDATKRLEEVFKVPVILEKAEQSKEVKARQSLPGKPAIVIVQ